MNIINFPLHQQPEPELQEINIDELNNSDFEKMYAPSEDIVCNNKCLKCGQALKNEYDQVWYFCSQQAGYGSSIDGTRVNISVCDSCIMEIIGMK